jgi:acetylornithine deacetylase/succinyl-diaminopimelate desuccinylase-like protein
VSVRDRGGRAADLLEKLVAIPSVTGNEEAVSGFLEERFQASGWRVQSIAVSPGRRNLWIHRGRARVVFSTHCDTVPEHFTPRREGRVLFARGACDAKASLAAMAVAMEDLGRDTEEIGLLVLVGEEKGSDGALAANRAAPPGIEFLIGGEPTGNRYVAGAKGCLRIGVETRGVAGHSSIEGDGSAIERMLDSLGALRAAKLPAHSVFGPTTMNIGVLSGGTAPNVIAESARAEIVFRTGFPIAQLLGAIASAGKGLADITVAYRSDPIVLRVPRGVAGDIVAFACDLPLLTRWGEPILIGPGAIENAHAAEEQVDLDEVEAAVTNYTDLARGLLSRGAELLEPRESIP